MTYSGGCQCGALRYEADGEPLGSGHCYCADCRRASGSGFIPFMMFPAESLRVTGEARQWRSPSFRGTEAVRNRCAACGSLVFGGELGKDDSHTIYAGTLDDPRLFVPRIAIFTHDRPDWSGLPTDIVAFAKMPERT